MSETKSDTKNTAEAPKPAPETEKPAEKAEVARTPKSAPKVDTAAEDAALAAELLEGSIAESGDATTGARGNMTIRELIMEYFSPTELITVKNPFDFNTGWVYSDPQDIKIVQPSAEDRQVYGIGREYAKTRILRAHTELVIPGWEAYVGLTRFFKDWAQREYKGRLAVALNNPATFRLFMSKVYAGKFDPNAGKNSEIDRETAARAALDKDLGLTN